MFVSFISFWFGFIPYEIYSVVGTFVAILQTLWLRTLKPVQVHILPHILAYFIFQSLHTGIAFSLATALGMEMNYSKDPSFFEIYISNQETKTRISVCGIIIAVLVALYEFHKKKHRSTLDSIGIAIIGIVIGFVSWYGIELLSYRNLWSAYRMFSFCCIIA